MTTPLNPPAELTRSSEFWFSDGTIVLQAGNTLYRVYRGLLASRSTVFEDTFSLPQPEPAEETNQIDGCAVVQLHDKAKDFTRFLKALHNYGSYRICPLSGFMELSSVLRLSDKYDVSILRKATLSILSDLYPGSLDRWAKRESPPGYRNSDSDHIPALNLAVKMNILPILPVVMYEVCCRIDLDTIVDGKGRDRIEDKGYRKKCILGYSRLQAAHREALRYLERDQEEEPCRVTPECNCDAERLRWIGCELRNEDEMDPLLDRNLKEWDNLEVCPECLESVKDKYDEARQTLWDELPVIFDLGTWEELLE
ncbi:hypothetical protein C8R47DRAFT_710507 [Mycena vitilis]|nr:hypothetical protein C8R47DRAFT_710507 [Mycena vitilis]